MNDETNVEETGADQQTTEAASTEVATSELKGYVLIGSTNRNHDDGDERIALENLQPTTIIDHLSGVSCSLDKPSESSEYGAIRLRIIQDAGGRAFVWRKDEPENGVTRFKVSFKHQAL